MDPAKNRLPGSRDVLDWRPTPFRVRIDSHSIQKPPLAPPHHQESSPPPPHHHFREASTPRRDPVITHLMPPVIIHATPNNFKEVVQSYTGKPSPTETTFSSSYTSAIATLRLSETTQFCDGSISSSSSSSTLIKNQLNRELGFVEGIDDFHHQQEQQYPAIPSPGFTSLPSTVSPFPDDITYVHHQPNPSPYSQDPLDDFFDSF